MEVERAGKVTKRPILRTKKLGTEHARSGSRGCRSKNALSATFFFWPRLGPNVWLDCGVCGNMPHHTSFTGWGLRFTRTSLKDPGLASWMARGSKNCPRLWVSALRAWRRSNA